jgi:hypothetical protein
MLEMEIYFSETLTSMHKSICYNTLLHRNLNNQRRVNLSIILVDLVCLRLSLTSIVSTRIKSAETLPRPV